MPNLKSSIKDVRRTKRRTLRNQARFTRIRTALRAVKNAESKEAAQSALREASILLDRAAHSELVHWRTAARHKSRLTKLVNKKYNVTHGSP